MRPTIGKVYTFDYENLFPVVEYDDRVRCKLKSKVAQKLVQELQENAEEIKLRFKLRKEVLAQEYTSARKKLQKLQNKREKGKRKSDEEKQAEKDLNELKKKYFPRGKKIKAEWKARNLFIRYYDPDQIIPAETGITAVYAGKQITPTGKIIHKWFCLSPSKIPAQHISERYLEII